MDTFRIIQPARVLAPFVKHVWLLKTAAGGDAQVVRTVPTGMMSLVFHRAGSLFSVGHNSFQPRAFLSGHERTFSDLRYGGEVDMISVSFRPAGARAFFDLPLVMAGDARLTGAEMDNRELNALEERVASTENDDECISFIENFLLRRLTRPAEYDLRRMNAAIGLIDAGETQVEMLAQAACLSTKQFDRVFLDHVGAHPKAFVRTIRFQRALHTLENNPEIEHAALAADCGFYDQPHLVKEFRAFSGLTPGQYLDTCPPHSDYFAKV